MPGTVTWTGGGNDGVWSTAGNWSAGTGSAPPANGDTVIIGATNQNIHGATVATTTLTIKVTAGYGGIIGDDTPLVFSSGMTLFEFAGTGSACNISCAGGTTTAANFYHTACNAAVTGGTWTTLVNSTGPLTVAAAAVVTTLKNITGTMAIGYNGTAITTMTTSGPITCSRSITTANVKAYGTLVHLDSGTTAYTTVGTANIEGRGTYNKRSGGTDTAVNAFPFSKFTIVGSSGGTAGTVTATDLTIWAGATIVDAVPGVVLTVTNGKTYVGQVGNTGITIP